MKMRRQARFNVFLGIDQTGAVTPGSQGRIARPLHWATVLIKKNKARLVIPEKKLLQFSIQQIQTQLPLHHSGNIAVLADCVLGLPAGLPSFQEAIQQLSDCREPYGRISAEKFFESLLIEKRRIPTRICEEWAKANSVFQTRPFQKNIQTGTYRFWRELAQDPDQAKWSIWPFQPVPSTFTLFEGYPSYLWRTLVQTRSRDPRCLADWLQSESIFFDHSAKLHFTKCPDLADAVILAAGGWILHQKKRLLTPFPGFFTSPLFRQKIQTEGWIAGLSSPLP